MRKLLFILSLLCIVQSNYSQNKRFYLHIVDSNFVPIEIKKNNINKEFKIKTRNAEFDLVLQKYPLKEFKQAFPSAHSKWLRSVFYIENESSEFSEEIQKKFKDKISHVETLCDPVLTYTPNDYNLAVTPSNLDLVKAKDAWDIVKDLPKISLGVTDTYFETTHEDLKNQLTIVGGHNNDTTSFHGTAVAGLLNAQTDNGVGISSIAFNAKIEASSNWGGDNEVLLRPTRV